VADERGMVLNAGELAVDLRGDDGVVVDTVVAVVL
jgi:hypothetical protein